MSGVRTLPSWLSDRCWHRSAPLLAMATVSIFIYLFLKGSLLPATQKSRVLSEELVPVSAEQVSGVCVRGEVSY